MERYLIVSGIAAALMAFLMVYLAGIARKIDLVDKPGPRKHHELEVPLIGGVGLGTVFFLSMLLMPFSLRDYRLLFFSGALILIIGVLDDRRDISASIKLILQVVICTILVTLSGLNIPDIGDVFSKGVAQGLNVVALPFTVLAIVGVINAVNMIDGHDGLAGGTSVISLSALAFLCYRGGFLDYAGVLVLLGGLTSVFLLFNLAVFGQKRKVFLGDAGSMFLGLLLAYFIIRFNNHPLPEHISSVGGVIVKTTAAPWLLGLPLLDLISSVIRRLFGTRPVMAADRGHVHHKLIGLGYSKTSINIILLTAHSIFVFVGCVGTIYNWADWILFWTPIALVGIYVTQDIYWEKKLFSEPWQNR
jgi:UDP-GlcNAc:undecaprenyl-phosphate/decaprenyl-phosphate GlcNAc-1-phosphate transferase